jgi:hypothetical protein
MNKTKIITFFRGTVNTSFVKEQISVYFCFLLLQVQSADWPISCLSVCHLLPTVSFKLNIFDEGPRNFVADLVKVCSIILGENSLKQHIA